jgi:formylglycine-generating enzyme required for sulfatase activity
MKLSVWLFLVISVACTSLPGQGGRALGRKPVEPLPATERAAGGGVFIGINQFEEGSSLNLRFAVDDAVAQAHVFVEELGLLQPRDTVLLIAGEPSMPANRQKLEALQARGVVVGSATRGPILAHVRAVARRVDAAGLLVISVASHGFERDGVIYVLPSDGYRDMLVDTGVNLNAIQSQMTSSPAGKKLLLVDACREAVGARGSGTVFSSQFQQAFADARGHAVLLSTGAGQLSYERPELGHGVFTYHLLQGLRGSLPGDKDGIIRLGALSDFVANSVREWWILEHPGADPQGAQQPWFSGEIAAKSIPLALSQSETQDRMPRILAAARQTDPQVITTAIENSVLYALREWPDHLRAELVAQLELLEINNPTLRRNFAVWWQSNGARLHASLRAASKPAPGQPWSVALGSGREMSLAWIPPGTFTMGSPDDEPGRAEHGEGPQTQVTISRGFWLGTHMVTNAQFQAFIAASNYEGGNDGNDQYLAHMDGTMIEVRNGDNFPVVYVSQADAYAFCAWLTSVEQSAGRLPDGYRYFLPTEAQWEYAARAGTRHRYILGDTLEDLNRIAWHRDNSQGRLQPVGRKQANPWGLFDMLGNADEWVFGRNVAYEGKPVTDWNSQQVLRIMPDLAQIVEPVIRGGSFVSAPGEVRVARRGVSDWHYSSWRIGFRVALITPPVIYDNDLE